jgi:hypothetical protein
MRMRTTSSRLCTLAIVVIALTPGVAADEPLTRVQIARIGKAATALVEVKAQRGLGYGSAFCVHADGWFLTSAHVAKGELTLVLNPSLKTEKTYPARVVRSDSDLDLALMHIENVKDLPALALGSDDGLEEQMDAMAFGFPLVESSSRGHDGHASISVNAGSITALRRQDGHLKEIQLDAELNPGNSGGPVLDSRGKVIGVVRSGLVARGLGRTGINQAIPVGEVRRFLARPEVEFNPPALSPGNLHKPTLFEAKVVPMLPSSRSLTVDLTLKPSHGDEQVVRMKASGTSHQVTAVPVPLPPGALRLRLLAVFGDGLVNAITTLDAAFKVGARVVKLSDARTVQLGQDSRVTMVSGEVLEGIVSGLEAVPVELGGQRFSLDFTRATEVKIAPDVSSDLVWCTLSVRDGDQQVWSQTDSLFVEGLLPVPNQSAGPSGIKPPALEANRVVRMLPSAAADVVVGGAGRYLVLKLPGAKRLAVFDVNAAQLVGSIPIKNENDRFAAGLEDVMVLQGASGTMERYSLKTLKRDASVALPVKGLIKSVAMGSASRGPLLVHWSVGDQQLDHATFTLIDPIRMRVRENDVKVYPALGTSYRDLVHLRASANGSVFGMWCTSHSPSGVGVIVATEPGAQTYYAHTSLGHVVPGPDGMALFTGRGTCRPQVSLTQTEEPQDGSVLPAEHGVMFLRIGPQGDTGHGAPRRNNAPNRQPAVTKGETLTICTPGRDKSIARLTDVDTVAGPEDWLNHDFTFDKRVHLIPDARLVITIPNSNDRLVLYRYGALSSGPSSSAPR